ncbi:MAG: RidA family protein [Rhodospirillaceae bacterium]
MSSGIEARLTELGLSLPEASAPVANYVPFAVSGSLVFISGQLPMKDGKLLFYGKVGDDVSVGEAVICARQSALNIIAQLKSACDGDLDRVKRIIKLGGFVAGSPDFTEHPKVINGASDLMVAVFGDAGRHARAAVGCPSLPLDAPVEVEAVVEIS